MRVHRIPFSTNVERVALALGIKGLQCEWVDHDAGDRRAIRAISGQDLVPVFESTEAGVLTDSMPIVAWLDGRHPEPPLYPADPARRRETEAFVAFFNFVWKVPPNALHDGVGDAAAWAAQLRGWLPGFEGLLHGRDFLFGAAPGAADVCAFPFLKYGLLAPEPADADRFHAVLAEHLALGDEHPRLAAWIRRMDALPRA